MDDDKRRLRLYQERYLADGDLHSDGPGRARRFRWKNMGEFTRWGGGGGGGGGPLIPYLYWQLILNLLEFRQLLKERTTQVVCTYVLLHIISIPYNFIYPSKHNCTRQLATQFNRFRTDTHTHTRNNSF